MNLLSLDKVTKEIAHKPLFSDLSFGIDDKDKIGLIGDNGCGKSTLLKVLAGSIEADQGNVSRRKNLHIAFASQESSYTKEQTVLEYLFSVNDPVLQIIKRYEGVSKKLETSSSDELLEELAFCTDEMERLDAWNRESQVKSILQELGIDCFEEPMENLSGGMRKKVFLAEALVQNFDLLILDEPTNHLDVETIIWIEGFLKKMDKALFLVTHDRYFLERVCNVIIELDEGQLYKHQGSYASYLVAREKRLEDAQNRQTKLNNILRKENEWLQRQPKARGGKDRGRIQRIMDMQSQIKKDSSSTEQFSSSKTSLGKKILEIKNISFGYSGDTIIRDFSWEFKHKERIALVGGNGSGKTTLLNLLTGSLIPESGIVDKGVHTRFGIFDQHNKDLDQDLYLLEALKEIAEQFPQTSGSTKSAAQFLEQFGFPKEAHYTPIYKLSGGEKRRLQIIISLLSNPNFLILDEPSNDLDIKTLQNLENYLEEFEGCVILVSHDRYLVDRVCSQLLVLPGDGSVNNFNGSFSDYLEIQDFKEVEKKEVVQKEKQVKEKVSKKGLSYNEKKEFAALEDEIAQLEMDIQELEKLFSSGDYDPQDSGTLNKRYSDLQTEVENKMLRWEELGDRS